MTLNTCCAAGLGAWVLILGIGLMTVPNAQAAEPASASSDRRPLCHPAAPPSRHCRPARTGRPVAPPAVSRAVEPTAPVEPYGILPQHVTIEEKIDKVRRDGKRSGLPPEVIEKIAQDMEKGLREDEARPKPTPRIGMIPGGELAPFPKYYSYENGWAGVVNGKYVNVYAGATRFDPRDDTIKFDPLTVHGFVIVDKGQLGRPDFKRKQLYTPTAVGSLRIVAAEGTTLTLQSRQGNRFSLNVETEQLTPLGNREPRPR